MDRITYSLRTEDPSSDRFYADASRLANEFLTEANKCVGGFIKQHVISSTPEESSLELLALGILWRQYGTCALASYWPVQKALCGLGWLRKQGDTCKAVADRVKGILLTLFIAPGAGMEERLDPFTPQQIGQLLAWLSAIGDFDQEVARLRPWHAFLLDLNDRDAADAARKIMRLVDWFIQRSVDILGRYTENVEQYLRTNHQAKRWQEDLVFCGLSRVEYHLNMMGAEILNRVFRPSFLRARQTELLLPGCMRAKSADACMAAETAAGLRCVGCTAGCHVRQLTNLGQKQGFSVYIASHESDVLAQGRGTALQKEQVGVVGVACVPNLIAGGWKLQAHKIAAQCVLLECSGCKKHWNGTGKPTNLNVKQLLRVVNKSDSSGQAVGE